MSKLEKLADSVTASVRSYVAHATGPLLRRLYSVEAKLATVATTAGPPGERGPAGEPGKDGAPGRDAAAPSVDEIAAKLLADTAALEALRGPPGPAGERGPAGEAGKSVTAQEVAELLVDARAQEILRGPPGERGQDGAPGANGKDGSPGRDGRDAHEITIQKGIALDRIYAPGVYASFRGGLVRSTRQTDRLGQADADIEAAGWEIIVEGVAAINLERAGLREARLAVVLTSGAKSVCSLPIKATQYRGVYKAGESYDEGDFVTRDGSVWHCNAATDEAPTAGAAEWTLAVKHGRDGKAGERGERGLPGAAGRDGRDLTQMGLDGRKW